ncbi:hypothetical protein PS1_003416 [Malus domestica]
MLFGSSLPMDKEIGDPPGAELVSNLPSCQTLSCVGEGVQELVMRPTPLRASSVIFLRGLNLSGTEQLIHRISLRAAMDIKSHIEKRIAKYPLEDLALLKEGLSKLVYSIDNFNVDSSLLRVKINELMAASTEYASLHAISSNKLASIDLSIAQVWSSQQATSEGYQTTWAYLASV